MRTLDLLIVCLGIRPRTKDLGIFDRSFFSFAQLVRDCKKVWSEESG
jgi:hypothetical protein